MSKCLEAKVFLKFDIILPWQFAEAFSETIFKSNDRLACAIRMGYGSRKLEQSSSRAILF
jgi:hypothetical protein